MALKTQNFWFYLVFFYLANLALLIESSGESEKIKNSSYKKTARSGWPQSVGPPPALPRPLALPQPPAPPPRSQSPNQVLTSNGPRADNIRCSDSDKVQSFTAQLSLPSGFKTAPMFNNVPALNPSRSSECGIFQNSPNSNRYTLEITNFDKCGVERQTGQDGKEWLSITVRFPFIAGLRMAEDEYIMVMCRPQEKTISKNKALDLRGNLESQSKTVFSNGPQDFECRISLFSRPFGSGMFMEELAPGNTVQIGQDVQLRGIVRDGDGWYYAVLRDVIVQRIKTSESGSQHFSPSTVFNPSYSYSSEALDFGVSQFNPRTDGSERILENKLDLSPQGLKDASLLTTDIAFLVFSDGCRNPTFKAIAPNHPYRDASKPLEVNFNFKAFMFDDMKDGDVLRISARVVACIEATDCRPMLCLDDNQQGYGRRKRDVINQSLVEDYNEDKRRQNTTSNFNRHFQLSVAMPGYAKTPLTSDEPSTVCRSLETDRQQPCILYIIGTSVVAIVFCVSTLVTSTFAVRAKRALSSPAGQPSLYLSSPNNHPVSPVLTHYPMQSTDQSSSYFHHGMDAPATIPIKTQAKLLDFKHYKLEENSCKTSHSLQKDMKTKTLHGKEDKTNKVESIEISCPKWI
ncbi:uncharacterized protein LOC106460564 [Limulus polyphemus]|uniref:Uncharacterized protein LOC106460564 n=1 Tax=Limulus polyphemus TaxID=6850 RepID=A0ABM1SIC4_LIMPO|nr:uncharacterized protein LOC106460564 [Limulus polyphemus]